VHVAFADVISLLHCDCTCVLPIKTQKSFKKNDVFVEMQCCQTIP